MNQPSAYVPVHPNFLKLAGEPTDAFCQVPQAEDVLSLVTHWPVPDAKMVHAVDQAISTSCDGSTDGLACVNVWNHGRPTGLWHWSWRASEDITPLNSGRRFTRYVWAILLPEGMLPSVRFSRSAEVATPPGWALNRPEHRTKGSCDPWTLAAERKVMFYAGIDLSDPLYPSPVTVAHRSGGL